MVSRIASSHLLQHVRPREDLFTALIVLSRLQADPSRGDERLIAWQVCRHQRRGPAGAGACLAAEVNAIGPFPGCLRELAGVSASRRPRLGTTATSVPVISEKASAARAPFEEGLSMVIWP